MSGSRERRRVVVTGLGPITPVGEGVDGLWAGLRRGESGVGPVTRFDASDFRGFRDDLARRYPFVPEAMLERMARAYGTRIHHILDGARALDDLGERIGGDLYTAEVDYLVQHEWARAPADVLWRRTKLGLFLDDAAQARLRAWFARNEAPELMAVNR